MSMPFKGFKTVVFGAAIGLIALFSSPEVQAFIAQHIPAIGGTVGGLVIVLRAITSSAIFKSD